MDVNGTEFHLLYGLDDWGRCLPQDDVSSGSAAQTLYERLILPDASDWPAFDWHERTRSLRLARQTVVFRHGKRTDPLALTLRRGAGRDRYGHWYWIDEDETGIRFLAYGETESVSFWTSTTRGEVCELPTSGEFETCRPPVPSPLLLRGLAVTTTHYLVVGNVTERGILVFDLHRGGPPMVLQWDVPFVPWDIVATPDGGVLILDRDNLMYWALDSNFRLLGEVIEEEALFQPEVPPGEPEPPRNIARRVVQQTGYSLTAAADPPPTTPISISPGPGGHVLILDAPDTEPSTIYHYDGETLVTRHDLEDAVSVFSEDEDGIELFSVRAHDFAYVECCVGEADDCPPCLELEATETGPARTLNIIYVAERDGDQVLAFVIQPDPESGEPALYAQPDFLPLRRWEGRGLINAAGEVYYDFAGRWVPLAVFTDCRYATRAVLWTPPDFEGNPPGQLFDSNASGCEWHRLLLDASIPAGTAVWVRARAADELELLEQTGWRTQPRLYLRGAGAELPFYDTRLSEDPAARAGTWELLFQAITGRYLQLELTLEGTGRSTPVIYALRAWYPRFSYLHNYLPAIYREEPVHASFLDRWLANFEGLYTNLEDMIDHLPRLLDPRSAPQDALDWLASWLGLVLDPLWTEERRRFFIQYAHELFKWRGTLRGLAMALRVYLDEELDAAIFDPEQYHPSFLDSAVRITENFLTRGGLNLEYGDPSAGEDYLSTTIDMTVVAVNAHRFTVLAPHCLTEEQMAMVERIVELEKPAHTAFELKRYWDLFRVGEARLGLDTQLGFSSAFGPVVLGISPLPDGYLQPPYPYDVADRIVLKRDRLGDYPEL